MPRTKNSYVPTIKQSDCETFIAQEPIKFVYFLRNPRNNSIKIGTSVAVNDRILNLSNQLKTRLEFMAAIKGDHILESELHNRFSIDALGNEWFNPSDDLLEYISKCPYHKIPVHQFPFPPKRQLSEVFFTKTINSEMFMELIELLKLNPENILLLKLSIMSSKDNDVTPNQINRD